MSLESLKNKLKSIAKFIIIPFGMVFLIIRIFLIANRSKANKSLEKTEKKDKDLEQEQKELLVKSQVHVYTAEQLAKELEEKASEDWHLRKKR